MVKAKLGTAAIEIRGNSRQLKKDLKNARRTTARSLKKTGRRMSSIGRGMTKGVTLPIVAAGAAVVKFGSDFTDAMTQSTAIMGDLSDAMKKDMRDAAFEVAKTTDKSATEAAESYFFLASAGLDAKESIEALPRVARFATAGQFDMAQATDLLTDAQSALGLSVEDNVQNMKNMTRVSDVLVKANQLANASVQQFSEALTNRAAAALKNANKDIEEGTAVLAAFADQGLKGRRAGTFLARILRKLSENAAKNTQEFKKLGLIDTEGNLNSLSEIIRIITRETRGLSDAQKSARLEQLGFTARIQAAIKPLLGLSNQVSNYERRLRSAGGATEEVADKQMQSFNKQIKVIWQRIKSQLIKVFLELVPILKKDILPLLEQGVVWLSGWVKWFSKLDKPTQKFIMKTVALIAVLGPLLAAIGPIIGALGSLFGLLSSAGPALAGVAAVLSGPVIAAIVAVGAAVVTLIAQWDDLVAAWEQTKRALGMGKSRKVRRREKLTAEQIHNVNINEQISEDEKFQKFKGMSVAEIKEARGRATGGSFSSGDLLRVGERGEELVSFGKGGEVISGSDIRSGALGSQGAGEGDPKAVFNFATGVEDTVKAQIKSMRRQLEEIAVGGIVRKLKEGGEINRTIRSELTP